MQYITFPMGKSLQSIRHPLQAYDASLTPAGDASTQAFIGVWNFHDD